MLRIVNYLILILYIFYTNPLLAVKSNWDGVDEAKVRIISPFSNEVNISSSVLKTIALPLNFLFSE